MESSSDNCCAPCKINGIKWFESFYGTTLIGQRGAYLMLVNQISKIDDVNILIRALGNRRMISAF